MRVEGLVEGLEGAAAFGPADGDGGEIETAEAAADTLGNLLEAAYRLADAADDCEPLRAVIEAAQKKLAGIRDALKTYLDREEARAVVQ